MGGGMLVQPGFGGQQDIRSDLHLLPLVTTIGGNELVSLLQNLIQEMTTTYDKFHLFKTLHKKILDKLFHHEQINKIFKEVAFFQKAINNPFVRCFICIKKC